MRIRAWLHPEEYAADEGLQAMQARYAIGAGGFWGKGLGQSLIKFKLSYSYNDFILAIICEELGVFGVIVMMTLFGYLLYRIYKIAQNAWDIEGKCLGNRCVYADRTPAIDKCDGCYECNSDNRCYTSIF